MKIAFQPLFNDLIIIIPRSTLTNILLNFSFNEKHEESHDNDNKNVQEGADFLCLHFTHISISQFMIKNSLVSCRETNDEKFKES